MYWGGPYHSQSWDPSEKLYFVIRRNTCLKIFLDIRINLLYNTLYADMAELADAPDLGSGVPRRAGSSPVIRIR